MHDPLPQDSFTIYSTSLAQKPLGSALNCLTGRYQDKSTALESYDQCGPQVGSGSTTLQFTMVENYEQLIESLHVKDGWDIDLGFLNVGGDEEERLTKEYTTYSRYIVANYQIWLDTYGIGKAMLDQDASSKLGADGISAFIETYGTHYVAGIVRGASLRGVFTFSYVDQVEFDSSEEQVRAFYNSLNAGLSSQQLVQQLSQISSATFQVLTKGPFCPTDSLELFLHAVHDLPQRLTTQPSIASPIGVLLFPYSSCENLPKPFDYPPGVIRTMEDIGFCYDDCSQRRNLLNYANRNQQQFTDYDDEEFYKRRALVEDQLGALDVLVTTVQNTLEPCKVVCPVPPVPFTRISEPSRVVRIRGAVKLLDTPFPLLECFFKMQLSQRDGQEGRTLAAGSSTTVTIRPNDPPFEFDLTLLQLMLRSDTFDSHLDFSGAVSPPGDFEIRIIFDFSSGHPNPFDPVLGNVHVVPSVRVTRFNVPGGAGS